MFIFGLKMASENFQALLGKLKDDPGFLEKFTGAADLDAALAIANDAGFDISKADLLKYQANQTLELSDEDLEKVAGGGVASAVTGRLEDRAVKVVDKALDSASGLAQKLPFVGSWFR